MGHALDLVTEVEMGVDLEDGDRPAVRVGGQDRDGDGVVAAEDDRHHVSLEQRAHGGLGPRRIARAIGRVAGDVAAVHDPLGPRQRGEPGVEVVMADERRQAARPLSDGGGGVRAGG